MSGVIVQKYGGSSVATVERLRQVAQLVVERQRQGNRMVVVVSAMGKTTDQLIAQAREVAKDPPRRELDMLVTTGERISMALLAMAMHELGADCISFTGSQSGIITDDSHQSARVVEVRPQRIEEELARGRIVIVAGYQGVSRGREITTLGRGGSDTTAVALAAALAAEACEIYSDVDGVYSADPNVCPQARLLPELSYEHMQTMAGAGAKVLNADAVEFARRAGIAVHARKTGDTSGRETRVHGAARDGDGVLAVVGASKVTHVRAPASELGAVLALVQRLGGRAMSVSSREDLSMWVDRTGIPGASHASLMEALPQAELTELDVVTLVGTALLAREVAPRALAALARAAIPVAGLTGGDLSLAFSLPRGRVDDAVRVLHGALVSYTQ